MGVSAKRRPPLPQVLAVDDFTDCGLSGRLGGTAVPRYVHSGIFSHHLFGADVDLDKTTLAWRWWRADMFR